MLINPANDTLFLSIQIPNVSNLLIYKDNWNNCPIMRKVIVELLRHKLFSKFYLGPILINYADDDEITETDCAFINIKIQGMTLLDYKPDTFTDYFITELLNKKNILHFDNVVINESKNLTSISLAIKITESGQNIQQKAQTSAA